MIKAKKNRKASGITLRDVMTHMRGMEQRLSDTIDKNTEDIRANTAGLQNLDKRLTGRVDVLEEHLTARIDALDEDLTATIKDTVKIRQHVGMSTLEEQSRYR